MPRFHPLMGSSTTNLLRLAARHRRDIDLWHRVLLAVGMSAALAPLRVAERVLSRRRINGVRVDGPVFIIGHWRTGTTHLHNLLTQDPQFGFVSNALAFSPNLAVTFRRLSVFLVGAIGPNRRPMDNMELAPALPQEEEFALANMSPHSYYLGGMMVPARTDEYFERYCTFEIATAEERQAWRDTYRRVMQVATVNGDGRRLVTKNPPNTARISELLHLYPDAQFIHIVRNPYEVFFSMMEFERRLIGDVTSFQTYSASEAADTVLRIYPRLMRTYLAQSESLRAPQLVEVRYEDLVADPIEVLGAVYEGLELSGFEDAVPGFKAYLDRIDGYQRNHLRGDQDSVARVEREWAFALERWGYDLPRSLA